MRFATILLCSLLTVAAFDAAFAQDAASVLQQRYGDNFEEVIDKHGGDPIRLREAELDLVRSLPSPADVLRSTSGVNQHYIIRDEIEPNNFFDQADDLSDVLAVPGPLYPDQYNGGLVRAALSIGDVDVFKFTPEPDRMYYFASTHSFLDSGADGLNVNMRLFHESDLDTTFVTNLGGIAGNSKMRGDILGRNTDGRNGSGDFRLTGWVPPIIPGSGEQLLGDYYLWIFNQDGLSGTYYLIAYSVPLEPWVSRGEPNQTFQEALLNPNAVLPADAVVRTYMGFNPDTVKVVTPDVPVQGNSVYPLLLAQGDEDIDHFRIDAKANHTLVIETMEYFGWYRNNDGSIGPGGTRLSDTRNRLYNADYTTILREDDDGARERMDGPDNIHSRMTYPVTEDGPLWLWAGAWASQTREPGRSVDNRDPGRFIYQIYATQYSNDPVEFEPNDTPEDATQILARADTVINASFSSASDVDYFRVFMNEVRMYTIFTQNSTVTSDVQVEIYHEYEVDHTGATAMTGNLAGSVAGNAGNNDFIIAGFVPERSGAYLIKLSSASAGNYQLGVVDKGEIYWGRIANEPDDVVADALNRTALEVGAGAAAVTAMIYPAGDVDHYHFTASAGTDVTLSLSGTHPALVNDFAGRMTLIDPNGNEVATNPTGISHTTAQSGTYLVRIEAAQAGEVGFYRLSGGDPFEETEPNDTFEQANLIALDQIYEASLTAGDVDFFKFTLEAGKLYSFRSLDNETGAPLQVEFYDQIHGENLMDGSGWFNNYAGDNFKIANIIPRTTQTYYLRVSGQPGPYKIVSRVNERFLALKDKGEPNDSADEADAWGNYQAFGVDQEFVLFKEDHPRWFGDEDWFRVELAAGQRLIAETKPVGGSLWNRDTDTRIVLWARNQDGDLEILVDDDDGGDGWYSFAAHTAPTDQVAYVQVRTSRLPDNADDRTSNRGDYILNIDVRNDAVEPNNTFAEADNNPLRAGIVNASFTVDEDEVDIYRLDLQADHIYHVRTIRPEGGFTGSFRASLFRAADTSTNLLDPVNTGYNTRYSGSNLKLNIIPEESEAYYLRLEGEGSGDYQIAFKGRDVSDLKTKGEPNNTIAEADAIGVLEFDRPGVVQTYMLFNPDFPWDEGMPISTRYSDDVDIYKYHLMAGDTLHAETTPVDGSLWTRDVDAFMRILNADGETLAQDDDGGLDWHSRIVYVAPATGDYYVMVRASQFGSATDRDPTRGEYNLTVLKLDGSPITVNLESLEVPEEFVLGHNYPNPFNPSTTITYSLPQATNVRLAIYNVLGQRVAMLVDEHQAAGQYAVQFDATHLSSGVYLYHLQAESFSQSRMMTLVK